MIKISTLLHKFPILQKFVENFKKITDSPIEPIDKDKLVTKIHLIQNRLTQNEKLLN